MNIMGKSCSMLYSIFPDAKLVCLQENSTVMDTSRTDENGVSLLIVGNLTELSFRSDYISKVENETDVHPHSQH